MARNTRKCVGIKATIYKMSEENQIVDITKCLSPNGKEATYICNWLSEEVRWKEGCCKVIPVDREFRTRNETIVLMCDVWRAEGRDGLVRLFETANSYNVYKWVCMVCQHESSYDVAVSVLG